MSTFPDDPNALLSRVQTADALTEAGYLTKPKTLATKATRGGGPPYRLFGARALYRWGDALEWAESRLSALRGSTSEADAARTGVAGMPNSETPARNRLKSHSERREDEVTRSVTPDTG
jgi:hypothetical protein